MYKISFSENRFCANFKDASSNIVLEDTVGVYSYEKQKYSCVAKFTRLSTLRNVVG
jgi:hypothetical protein